MPNDINNSNKLKIFEIILLAACFLSLLIFTALLIYVKVFPAKYIVPIALILLVLFGIVIYIQIKTKKKSIGKCLIVLLCIMLIYSSVYLYKFNEMVTTISDAHIKLVNISVIVLKNNPAQTLEDAKDYTFGINQFINTEDAGNTLQNVKNELGVEIKSKTYSDFYSLIEALYSGEADAILINEGFRGMINNLSDNFDDNTRVLASKYIEKQIQSTEIAVDDMTKKNDVVNETETEKNNEDAMLDEKFIVYISGIDTYGPISTTSRSDTNILAAINIKTRQIQLISTPRDYYIEIPVEGWQYDKLTHSGVYGVDISMGALEKLYDINIDYYLRINETSFVDFVDALGGIEVISEFEFTIEDYYHIKKGKNHFDGKTALVFAEERKSFTDGDIQRGKNQMLVIYAIFNKAMSPATLPGLGDIIDSVSNNFETNMSKDKITGLIKMQLDDGGTWDLNTYGVDGIGAVKKTYSSGERQLSVIIPDQSIVDEAKAKILNVIKY